MRKHIEACLGELYTVDVPPTITSPTWSSKSSHISGPQSNTSHSPVISQLHKQFSWADQWQIPPSLRLAVAAARAHSLPGPHGVSWKKWHGDGWIYPTKTWGKTMRKPFTSPVLRVNWLAFYKTKISSKERALSIAMVDCQQWQTNEECHGWCSVKIL